MSQTMYLGKYVRVLKKKKKGKICWNRSIIFLWRQRFFQITSLSWFACKNEMWLCNGTKPWWRSHPWSGIQEGRIPHSLSFECSLLQRCLRANSDVKASQQRQQEERVQPGAPFFLAALKCVAGEQSPSSVVLQNCSPCRKGKLLQFSAFPLPCCYGFLEEKNVSVENNE